MDQHRATTGPETPTASAPSRWASAGLLVAVVAAALVVVAPQPEGLEPAGQRLGAVFLAGVILWATESLPIGVTALLVVLLQPVAGARPLGAAFTSFMSPVFFFVLAMFCLAAAILQSGLDRRFSRWLVARAGREPRRLVAALMAGTAALSTVMSDVPACAIFMTVGVRILGDLGLKPGASNLGKAVMIGIPVASLIGGVATPAGSSINVLGMHFIEEYGQIRIPFVSWMAIGVPMTVGLVPIAWWLLVRWFPTDAEDLDLSRLEDRTEPTPLTSGERKVLALLAVMLTAWIAGSWIPALDVAFVALAGSVAMFLPGLRLLTWPQAQRAIGWDILLMIGGVTSLGAASVETGLARWIVEATLGGAGGWPPVAVIAAISAFTVAIHLVLPVGPVINAVLIPPIIVLAREAGQNPALYALPVAFTASCAFLLPLDPVPLLTYSTGYYRMTDMLKPGTILGVFWVIWMTALMVVIAPALGFF